ncbi:MAG: alpha/beta fold hydrolase [Nitrospirota bacterium]|nr:alpha/beta fold hydrolase [Nitrospirota bacterium]MDH5585530.1 alpha/beta fold hydrolase [Nitrospirota bacterium]
MTIVPRWWPRGNTPAFFLAQQRIFQITPETGLLTQCHWQPSPTNKPTVLLIHGLEGCTESHYMVGLAHKIWAKGWNCIRINQRNCGDSEHLTPTLYHNGLSQDYSQIIQEITNVDGCRQIWVIGYSMGGNLTLKLAGEMGGTLPTLSGVAAVSPNIQPAACVRALQHPSNWIYHHHFLRSLKAKLTRKDRLYPGKWNLAHLPNIQTMWEFDDVYTAPDGGYRHAEDYYEQSAAEKTLTAIRIPTLIITAQDDPFIPYDIFHRSSLHHNALIELFAPSHGGHCGFVQHPQAQEDSFWAENRIIDWIEQKAASLDRSPFGPN